MRVLVVVFACFVSVFGGSFDNCLPTLVAELVGKPQRLSNGTEAHFIGLTYTFNVARRIAFDADMKS